jgi:hypothetical protein
MSLSDWTIDDPESAGLRSEPLHDMIEWLDGFSHANIHSVLVVRHGRLLFEHYRPGEYECWGEPLGNVAHGPDTKHDLRSVTKSVISLLLGVRARATRCGASGGKIWNYNSGCTLLLEAVIAKAADGALDDVASEFLFNPLGITTNPPRK